ncbi:unnamed protein product [Rhizophagus irregularis]|nr:unnamed protein product [Rhizophagus irregularis]
MLHFFANVYLWLSIKYHVFVFIIAIIFRLFFIPLQKKINIQTHFNSTWSEYVSLKEWMISFIFNTKSLFNEPWMASSPRDFWSTRWQLFLNETFKELGFLPVKNLLNPFVPRKIANMMRVLGAFAISSLLHEYIIIGNYNIWTGEQTFFMV